MKHNVLKEQKIVALYYYSFFYKENCASNHGDASNHDLRKAFICLSKKDAYEEINKLEKRIPCPDEAREYLRNINNG